jgi:hypothetical protein
MRSRRSLCVPTVLTASLVVVLVPATGLAQDPPPLPRPDAIQQPLEDGCQRSPAGLLTFTSPEWVFVYANEDFNPDPGRARVMEGFTPAADLAAGDLPQNHTWYDFNADVHLDPAYEYLAGGSLGDPDADPPVPPSGNLAEYGGEPIVHVEWESGTLPSWAWPSAGDRLKLWGSWVWDCGHWGQGFTSDPNDPAGTVIEDTDYFLPGTNQNATFRGEGTEFHPMQAVVATRENPWEPPVQESETDVFISTDATFAYSESVCSRQFPPPATPPGVPPLPYPPAWTACVQNPATAHQPVNDRDYTFFVPAPPKPTPDAELRYRVVEHEAPGRGPDEHVDVQADGIEVTVPFDGFGSGSERLSYAKSFFLGWSGAIQYRPAHLQVDLKRLTVHHTLDGPEFGTSLGVPPGEWGLYLDVNGFWKFVNEWAPGLAAVLNDGDFFDLDRTLDIYVPAGEGVRLEIDGRECDLPRILPCPATSEVAEDNDVPGTAIDEFASAEAALGDHVLKPPGDDPRYELGYTIRQISPATIGPPDGTCVDTFLPRSRIRDSSIRANAERLAASGKTRDRNCRGPGHGARRVEVSVAMRELGIVNRARGGSPGFCRHLRPGGRLTQPRPCLERVYLPTTKGGHRLWHLRQEAALVPGRYVMRSRAIDRAGNVETQFRPANVAAFRVRDSG